MKTISKAVLALLVFSLTVFGVSSCSSESNAIRNLDKYLGQQISWERCKASYLVEERSRSNAYQNSSVDCSSVLVPATYQGSQLTPEFEIQMMRLHSAANSEYLGTLFINPGGPGGSGIEQVQYSEFPPELLKHYNIIGFDPRGVGKSILKDEGEIKCSDTTDYKTYFDLESSPENLEEFKASIPVFDNYYTECAKANPFWWTLSTENVVKDLELMRAVVSKDEPLNFIGSSYGTTIAGLYISRFPEHVGKMVLDSPTTANDDLIGSALENYKSIEAKINTYLDFYALKKGISSKQAWDQLLRFRQLADDDELYGYAGIYQSEIDPDIMISSESLLVHGIEALSYIPESDAKSLFVTGMDNLAEYGDNSLFEYFALQLDGYDPESLSGSSLEAKNLKRTNAYEVMTIVNSLDYAPEELDTEEQKLLMQKAKLIAPKYIELQQDSSGFEYFGPSLGLDWRKMAANDDSIPDPPTDPLPRENKSGKKVLVIGAIHEAVTPYKFSKETAKLLNSPLISVDDSVHAPAAYYNNACLNEVLINYFVRGIVPEDLTCSS